MEDYKFWKTQPVPSLGQDVEKEGPIDVKTIEEVPKSPSALPQGYEWTTLDLDSKEQVEELYELLYNHYIEDKDESLRFKYHPALLLWALKPPGWVKDWNVGVKVQSTGKLVAFIAGTPATLRVRENDPFKIAEINFLVVHKKLRSKRMAPVLIKEVTRRVNLTGVWQALYTAGIVLPKPVSVARYFHRPLQWSKLNDIGFSGALPGMSKAQMVAKFVLPKETNIPGVREMEVKDIPRVTELLTNYLEKFELALVMDEAEVKHWLLGGLGIEKVEEKPIFSYVVEDPKTQEVTDFFSFFRLNSTILDNPKYDEVVIAYDYYYASATPSPERFKQLHYNALILAKNLGFDVYNAVSILDNPTFLEELKFGVGTGSLNYYLFNYKAFGIHGGFDKVGGLSKKDGQGVGVILL